MRSQKESYFQTIAAIQIAVWDWRSVQGKILEEKNLLWILQVPSFQNEMGVDYTDQNQDLGVLVGMEIWVKIHFCIDLF